MFDVDPEVKAVAGEIVCVSFDVDGVLTDGRITYGSDGTEYKAFHVADGAAIKALTRTGVAVALITGRSSTIVERRAAELGIRHVYQGREDKLAAFGELTAALNLPAAVCAHVGDDLADVELMNTVGLPIAVADAHRLTKAAARYVTQTLGGRGVAREVAELILDARGAAPNPG